MVEDKDKRTGWLRDVKVGDKVAVVKVYDDMKGGVYKVEKITPTGIITVTNGSRFKPTGGDMVTGYARDHYKLAEPTEERVQAIRNENRRLRLARKLRDFNYTQLTLEDLEALEEAIDWEKYSQ